MDNVFQYLAYLFKRLPNINFKDQPELLVQYLLDQKVYQKIVIFNTIREVRSLLVRRFLLNVLQFISF